MPGFTLITPSDGGKPVPIRTQEQPGGLTWDSVLALARDDLRRHRRDGQDEPDSQL